MTTLAAPKSSIAAALPTVMKGFRAGLGVLLVVALLKSAYQVGGLWVWSGLPTLTKSIITVGSLGINFLALMPIWYLMQRQYRRRVLSGWSLAFAWWAYVVAQAILTSAAETATFAVLFANNPDLQVSLDGIWRWNFIAAIGSVTVLHHIIGDQIAVAAARDAQLAQIATAREQDAAQLQLLQAQMEPHFLFNALANARRLIRTEPAAARDLLGDLLHYVEAALPTLRQQDTTLAQEAKLVESFLAIHQVRMGKRLRFRVEIDPQLNELRVPSMSLLTLVENALKHGIGPLVEGGAIEVAGYTSADGASPTIVLEVADTGRGMGSGGGSGSGLLNARERFKALHGPDAQLSLSVNEPRGVIARVRLPASAVGARA
jgi:signal transduction histidine kinase